MLIQKLVHAHVTTASPYLNLVLLDADNDALGPELVDALTLAHEHDFELVTVRIVVNELCNLPIDMVILNRYVDRNLPLQVDDVVLEGLHL